MKIKSAEFVISNSKVNALPHHDMPEYAFIGRSNVGKSSLINAIAGNKNLAKTSQKPGKTLLMNHFLINGEWYLVDLPGYGYASVSKKMRDDLEKMIKSYVLQRDILTNLFVLIDSRLEPQAIDVEFMNFLGVNGIPFSIIFTKIDKLSQSQLNKNLKKYHDKLFETWEELPPMFATSSEKRIGIDDVLDYIEQINEEFKKAKQ